MPKVSVIIPTLNAKNLLEYCLESVFRQTYRDFEVIVIDNGSSDGTQNFIWKYFPQVSLISNRVNRGASFARNQGIKTSTGDWILSLDCDVTLSKDFLKEMFDALNGASQRIGMVGGKVYNQKKRIYSTGIVLTKIRRFYERGGNQTDCGQFDRKLDIFGPSSVAALYKREMLEGLKIDGEYFDNDFYFLVEDVDLSWRAQRIGWQGRFAPKAICFHRGDSSQTDKKKRQFLCFRNRYFLIFKNENFLRLILFLPIFLLYEIPRLLYLLATNSYILRTGRNMGKHFRNMLGKRKLIRKQYGFHNNCPF